MYNHSSNVGELMFQQLDLRGRYLSSLLKPNTMLKNSYSRFLLVNNTGKRRGKSEGEKGKNEKET